MPTGNLLLQSATPACRWHEGVPCSFAAFIKKTSCSRRQTLYLVLNPWMYVHCEVFFMEMFHKIVDFIRTSPYLLSRANSLDWGMRGCPKFQATSKHVYAKLLFLKIVAVVLQDWFTSGIYTLVELFMLHFVRYDIFTALIFFWRCSDLMLSMLVSGPGLWWLWSLYSLLCSWTRHYFCSASLHPGVSING